MGQIQEFCYVRFDFTSSRIKVSQSPVTWGVFTAKTIFASIYRLVRQTKAVRPRSEVWVLKPKEVAGWLRNEPEVLSADDVAMATLDLKQFVKRLAA